jgi:hypothetical protein
MDQVKENIKQFISHVVNKDYKQANNSLQKTIENKLKDRIKSSLETKN